MKDLHPHRLGGGGVPERLRWQIAGRGAPCSQERMRKKSLLKITDFYWIGGSSSAIATGDP